VLRFLVPDDDRFRRADPPVRHRPCDVCDDDAYADCDLLVSFELNQNP
jgi:hypothetical protein